MTTDNTKEEVKSQETGDWGDSGSYKIPETRDELQTFLNGAMSLELSTLPLYLQAWFSLNITTKNVAVQAAYNLMKTVVVEEMLHMNIVSNLILSIFGDQKTPVVTKYNINYEKNGLPQNIRPDLTPLTLNRFGQAQLFAFSQVECETLIAPNDKNNKPYPYCPGDKTYADVYFDKKSPENTIGEFYNALGKGIQNLSSGDKPQITFGNKDRQFFATFHGIVFPAAPEILGDSPPKIESYDFAKKLINGIIEQGEAFDVPSLLKEKKTYMKQDSNTKKWTKIIGGEFSHFLKFVELLVGYEIISTEPQKSTDPNQFCIRFNYDIDGAKYKFKLDDTNLYPQKSIGETKMNSLFAQLLANLETGLNAGNINAAGKDMGQMQQTFIDAVPTYSNWQTSYPDPTTVPQKKQGN